LEPERSFFEDEEFTGGASGQRVCHPKLEWHVEPRNRLRAGEIDPAEVVDRRTAALQQAEKPLQTIPASTWNFEHATRCTAQSREASDQRKEDRSVLGIKGYVEEDALPVKRRRRFRGEHSGSELATCPSGWSDDFRQKLFHRERVDHRTHRSPSRASRRPPDPLGWPRWSVTSVPQSPVEPRVSPWRDFTTNREQVEGARPGRISPGPW